MIVMCKPTFQSDTPFIEHYGVKGMRWGYRKRKYDRMLKKNTRNRQEAVSEIKNYRTNHTSYDNSVKKFTENINKYLNTNDSKAEEHYESEWSKHYDIYNNIDRRLSKKFEEKITKATLADLNYKKDYESGKKLLEEFDLSRPFSDLQYEFVETNQPDKNSSSSQKSAPVHYTTIYRLT